MHPGQAAQASATGRNDVPVSRLAQKPCLNCRRRKVKCDRGNPCLECLRFAKTCNYDDPNPGLEQSPPSLVQQEELLSRLDKLEKSLEQRADASLSQTLIPLTLRAPSGASLDHESISDRDNQRIESGSLIIERGQSLYLAAGHWAKLFEETEESKILLNSDLGTPHQTGPSALFGSDLSAISHVPQHPTAVQTKVLCDYFFGKIEPFIRILHEPTFRREHQQFQLGRHESPLEFKAILFVIYALTILLCPSEVIERHFGEPINDLLGKYQVDIELALSRIHFLRSRKLLTFQALLYWITFLYESGDFETASSMVGLATQIAHRLGLHKDPALSYNTPFVGEMRKRAWNHLYYFNLKTYEIDGLDHQLSADDASANIFPSNTDDALWENWLHTQLSRPPQSREGFSGMAFVLLRRQLLTLMAILLRQIADLPKERAIGLLDEARERFKAQYFRHFDISEPMQRLVEAYSSIAFDRITLAVDIGHVKYGRTQTDEAKNDIFFRAIDILGKTATLEAEYSQSGYSWIFRANPEWHAAAALLCHIRHRANHFTQPDIERAWQQAELFFLRHDNAEFTLRNNTSWQVIEDWRQQAIDWRIHSLGINMQLLPQPNGGNEWNGSWTTNMDDFLVEPFA